MGLSLHTFQDQICALERFINKAPDGFAIFPVLFSKNTNVL